VFKVSDRSDIAKLYPCVKTDLVRDVEQQYCLQVVTLLLNRALICSSFLLYFFIFYATGFSEINMCGSYVLLHD